MNFKPLIVQADPIWKGKHPYHDHRFITTNHQLEAVYPDPATGEEPTWQFCDSEGRLCDGSESVIAQMRDCEGQEHYARLFAAAPALLHHLKIALNRCGWQGCSEAAKLVQAIEAGR